MSVKIESDGDHYSVAGALLRRDEDGFLDIELPGCAYDGADKVMAFAKVCVWSRAGFESNPFRLE